MSCEHKWKVVEQHQGLDFPPDTDERYASPSMLEASPYEVVECEKCGARKARAAVAFPQIEPFLWIPQSWQIEMPS